MKKNSAKTPELPSKRPARRKRFVIKEIDPASWPEVEKALSKLGSCGGCWCSFWRLDKAVEFSELRGAAARKRLQQGVKAGSVHGLVAYMDEEPVGWCTFGPRADFPGLTRFRRAGASNGEWSIPCFFVKPGYSQLGVSSALLVQALRILRDRHIKVADGYPALVPRASEFFPDFTWTGAPSMCLKAGFDIMDRNEAYQIRDQSSRAAKPSARKPARA